MKPALVTCLSLAWLVLANFTYAQSSQVEQGRRMHEDLLKTERFHQGEALNAYVNEIGQRLAANSSWPDLEYHFFVLDDPGINAFALPGGYIYINRGLLSFMTSESQLAAVLAHEIAHVTQRHHSRQSRAANLGNLAAFVATVATWNSSVGEAVSLWNAERISGFGRDMELEADEYGAVYLYRTGYDPQAIIEVLGILKDHETFMSREARAQGRSSTYHGVFASHPRNDTRLKEVVAQAGVMPPGEGFQGRDEYRQITDGLLFGPALDANAPPGFNRFIHRGLGVTFLFPADWSRQTQGSTITLEGPGGLFRVSLSVVRITDAEQDATSALLGHLGAERLRSDQPLYSDKEKAEAVTGLVDTPAGRERVAAIKYGGNFYFFRALAPLDPDKAADETLLGLMGSFRDLRAADIPPDFETRIYYRRLEPGETFADLASSSPLGNQAETYLRLLNGYYPNGESQPGTWMKLVK